MKEIQYYSIGQVSKICRIPIKTLRYYDEIKVLIPNIRKETSNYRYYSKEQLIIAFMIRNLRSYGFNLKEIKEIIERNEMEGYISGLDARMRGIQAEIEELKQTYCECEALMERLDLGNKSLHAAGKQQEGETGILDCKIETIPEITLLTSRSIIPSYHNEEVSLEKWIEINEEADSKQMNVAGSTYVTFYTDLFGQFFSKDCDVEFAIQVDTERMQGENIRRFGGFTAATAIYCGNYANIFKAYISLKRWIDAHDYEVDGNVTEQFLISPIDTRNEKEHVTKIIVPVKLSGKVGKEAGAKIK